MNGIRWSVDDWFRSLLSESGEFRKYVIVYTSDHGQNIVDDGTLATHCRPRANRFEGIVPMMVFSNGVGPLERLKAAQVASYDQTSHFQVFPTLLLFAGYNESWVESHYGAPLSKPSGTAPEFLWEMPSAADRLENGSRYSRQITLRVIDHKRFPVLPGLALQQISPGIGALVCRRIWMINR